MRKAFRDKELAVIFLIQFYREPLPKGSASLAQINSHIKYSTLSATYKFGLAIRWPLEMQSAYNAIGRARLIVLDKLSRDARFIVTLLVIGLYKIASGIFVHLWLNNEQSFDWSFDYILERILVEFGYILERFHGKSGYILEKCCIFAAK